MVRVLLRRRPTRCCCGAGLRRALATQPPQQRDGEAKGSGGVGSGAGAASAAEPEREHEAAAGGLRSLLSALDPLTRRQLGVLAAGTGIVSLGFGMVVPVLPQFAAQWGEFGATGVGLVVAAPAVAKLALNRAAGRRADSHGRVPLMAAGAATSAVGNFACAAASSIGGVCGARLAVGAGSAAGGAATQAYLADVTAKFPQHRGAIMGTLGSIGMMSYGFGPAAGGLLAGQFGPSVSFGAVGVGSAICGLAYASLPETLPPRPAEGKGEGSAEADAEERTFGQLLSGNPRLQALLVMDSAVYVGWAVWLAVVPLHAAAVWDATPATLGVMYSVMAIAGAIGAPLGGVLSDRFGREATVVTGGSLCAVSTLLLPYATSMVTFGAYLVIWDFAEGVLGAALSALAADVAEERERAQIFALRSQVESGIFLVAPVAVGLVADVFSLSTSLWLASATMGTGVVGFRMLFRNASR